MKKQEAPSILIVDDNYRNLQILVDILRSCHYRVAVVKDGRKALDFLKTKRADLILLDIMMPGMSGIDVCLELKKDEVTMDIPVLFISALADTEDKIRGFEAGGVDYITKPFHKEEVLARIKTHLELNFSKKELKRAYEELKIVNKKLEIAARTDSLTKLSNRRDILEKMKYEKSRADRSKRPFTVIICDIDDFKKFNDNFGHDCGDHILRSIADFFRLRVRKQDVVARWGGEEFLIFLPETDLEGGLVLAEDIRCELNRKSFKYENRELQVQMTFGVATYQFFEKIDLCIRMADKALYRGKSLGKNRVITMEDGIDG